MTMSMYHEHVSQLEGVPACIGCSCTERFTATPSGAGIQRFSPLAERKTLARCQVGNLPLHFLGSMPFGTMGSSPKPRASKGSNQNKELAPAGESRFNFCLMRTAQKPVTINTVGTHETTRRTRTLPPRLLMAIGCVPVQRLANFLSEATHGLWQLEDPRNGNGGTRCDHLRPAQARAAGAKAPRRIEGFDLTGFGLKRCL